MIVVMPNAYWNELASWIWLARGTHRRRAWAPAAGGSAGSTLTPMKRTSSGDIMPFVDKAFPHASPTPRGPRAGRPLDGRRHHGQRRHAAARRVRIIAMLSGGSSGHRRRAGRLTALDPINPDFMKDPAGTNKKLRLLFFSCGTEDPRMASHEAGVGSVEGTQDQLRVQDVSWRARVEGLAAFAGRHGADALQKGARREAGDAFSVSGDPFRLDVVYRGPRGRLPRARTPPRRRCAR